jgi:YD repeat-containing protein
MKSRTLCGFSPPQQAKSATQTQFAYDGVGNLTRITDVKGNPTTYTHWLDHHSESIRVRSF